MSDADGVAFLQWALPRLGMRWRGFRKPRRQVLRRIRRRMDALGIDDWTGYRALLDRDPDEWGVLDGLCRVTISCFRRDHSVWDALRDEVLPALIAGRDRLRAWSAGCASGEEAYTLALLWHLEIGAPLPLEIVGTDIDPEVLERARTACYAEGSLRGLPSDWRQRGFVPGEDGWCIPAALRRGVRFIAQDIRSTSPEGLFDLVFCRNLAFTYFDDGVQAGVQDRLLAHLRPGGALVVGRSEALPAHAALTPWRAREHIYRRQTAQ